MEIGAFSRGTLILWLMDIFLVVFIRNHTMGSNWNLTKRD